MADGAGDKAELEVAVGDHEAKVALWVASAVARASILVLPPALAARAAVLAFGDELLDVQLPNRNDQWLAPGGRDLAAAYLLQRAETALRQEPQRLADAAKRARLVGSSSGGNGKGSASGSARGCESGSGSGKDSGNG